MYLRTDRLILLSTPLHVILERLERDDFHADVLTPEGPLRVRFPPEWPGAILPFFPTWAEHYDPRHEEWGGVIVERATSTAVGQMGFKGRPDARGDAEFGYGLGPTWWGRGYATEMARALVTWGLAQPGVRRVTAETLPDNAASIRVLEKAGLRLVGERVDPEDGRLLRWATKED
ncbi:GNAT family N-acetyltransferase [Deinococcus pimensis]|uniref:GNAT family N-acetyltransferase n=1 Tax=Deinococcus pimensis TaxID=309888 RepID=UPI0004819744|nr:GNAT family N-acetyltransferase [Deinococcus pimensis]